MKKIIMMLCAFLVVGSGEYAVAMKGVEGKASESVGTAGTEARQQAPSDIAITAQKYSSHQIADHANDARSKNMDSLIAIHEIPTEGNNIAGAKNSDISSFKLQDGSQLDVTFTDNNGRIPKTSTISKAFPGIGRKATDIFTHNTDGPMIQERLNLEGKVIQRIQYSVDGTFDITNFDETGKVKNLLFYDKSNNLVASHGEDAFANADENEASELISKLRSDEQLQAKIRSNIEADAAKGQGEVIEIVTENLQSQGKTSEQIIFVLQKISDFMRSTAVKMKNGVITAGEYSLQVVNYIAYVLQTVQFTTKGQEINDSNVPVSLPFESASRVDLFNGSTGA